MPFCGEKRPEQIHPNWASAPSERGRSVSAVLPFFGLNGFCTLLCPFHVFPLDNGIQVKSSRLLQNEIEKMLGFALNSIADLRHVFTYRLHIRLHIR